MPLHLSRVAFGSRSLEDIARFRDMFAVTMVDGRRAGRITSRRTPRRADELQGGSLYWIIAHTLVARQTILGVEPLNDAQGVSIFLGMELVPVVPIRYRAHQGWRYLLQEVAPPDLASGQAALPADMLRELASLGLG
ncbi:MAG: DUF1489 family protein [Thermaurantiacus sp.]